MKIGVYGDSFCDSYETSRNIAWYTILLDYIPNSTLKNYGRGSTSVYYSYTKFLETYQKFDKIIFLVTNPDRYTKLVQFTNEKHDFFSSIRHTDVVLNKYNDLSSIDKKVIENLRGWFMSVDSEYNSSMTELMLRDMENLHNDIMFFPCFFDSLLPERIHKCELPNDANMINILKRQKHLLGNKDIFTAKESPHHISCHLTEEFNLFVAKLFADKIMHNQWNWNSLEDVKLNHEFNYYYNTQWI